MGWLTKYGTQWGDVPQTFGNVYWVAPTTSTSATYTVEGRERYPIRVRYARDFRESIDKLRNVLVTGSNGVPVPLCDVAQLGITVGPSMITSENSLLRGTVLMNVQGRDVGGFGCLSRGQSHSPGRQGRGSRRRGRLSGQ